MPQIFVRRNMVIIYFIALFENSRYVSRGKYWPNICIKFNIYKYINNKEKKTCNLTFLGIR